MDIQTIAKRLRDLLAEIEGTPAAIETEPTPPPPVDTPAGASNPYADTPDMIPMISDDHLEASPKITDNGLASRYWRTIWDIADKADGRLIILRGAHPDGRVDIQYPSIEGKLDKDMMARIIYAFLAVCGPWGGIMDEREIRMGSDVWPLTSNPLIKIDDLYHHRYDDPVYPHFHVRVA